ncbi:MAG: hypothetical protein LC792_01830 [Actinobacteria bacterium]|nr:hypothetical protein [Actinomycetota bacterium]
MMLRSEPEYVRRAKSLMAGGFALLAFVVALAVGTAGSPALGGVSWVMVTVGAGGVVYVAGAVIVAAAVDLRGHFARRLRPATVVSSRGGRLRSIGR